MNITESILIALNSIKDYKLRASLTLISVAIGVFAIMFAGTLIDSMNKSIDAQLDEIGENTFYFMRLPNIQMGNTWRKYRKRKAISYSQYQELKDRMTITDKISGFVATSGVTIKYDNFSTDPDVQVIGSDENYLNLSADNLTDGRVFTREDLELNKQVVIIGNDVKVKLFPALNPVGKEIIIGNQAYKVIGVLEEKGAVLGQSQDNKLIIPIPMFLKYHGNRWNESLTIIVKAPSREALMPTMDEAIGALRTIRNVKPWQENSFEVETNESLSSQFSTFTNYLAYFGFVCGFIALIAAGVGIMNMMLVSVKERTREIGIRKAVGAKRSWILGQFIVESITLTQIGGLFGIALGVIAGGGLSSAVGLNIYFSFTWFFISLLICMVIGVLFGAYPAWKAAKLDPIEALRYE